MNFSLNLHTRGKNGAECPVSYFAQRFPHVWCRLKHDDGLENVTDFKVINSFERFARVFFIFRNCSSPVNDMKSPVLQLCGRRGHLTNFLLFISKPLIKVSFQESTNLASLTALNNHEMMAKI